MATTTLDILVQLKGGHSVKRALRGVTEEVVQSERKAQRAVQQTEETRKRGLDRSKGAIARFHRWWSRDHRRVTREMETNHRNMVVRMARNAREIMSTTGRIVGRGLIGAGFVAGRILQTQRELTGQATPQEIRARAREYELRAVRLEHAQQVPEDVMARLDEAIRSRAGTSTLQPMQMLEAAERVAAVQGAEALPAFIDTLEQTGNFAEGFGAELSDLAITVINLKETMDVSAEDMSKAIGSVVQSTAVGAIELRDFASAEYGVAQSVYSQVFQGMRGVEGAADFSAGAQAIGREFKDAPELAATALRSLLQKVLTQPTSRQNLYRTGVLRRGEDVEKVGLEGIARGLAREQLSGPELRKIFKEDRAVTAAIALAKNIDIFDALRAQDPLAAARQAQAGVEAVRQTTIGKNLRDQAKTFWQVDLQQGEYLREIAQSTDEIGAQLPWVIEGLKQLTTAITSLLAARIVLGGGGGVLGGAAAGGVLGKLGALGAFLGKIGLAAGGGALAGYLLDRWVEDVTGEKLTDKIGGLFAPTIGTSQRGITDEQREAAGRRAEGQADMADRRAEQQREQLIRAMNENTRAVLGLPPRIRAPLRLLEGTGPLNNAAYDGLTQ